MWTKSKSLLLTRAAILLFMLLLLSIGVLLPRIVDLYIKSGLMPPEDRWPTLILGWLFVPPAFIALICMNGVLKNIRQNQIFIHHNVKLFRTLSWCCCFAALPLLLYGWFDLASFVFAGILGLVTLLLRVAKNMLEAAVNIKEENDLTV